jgi:DNA/RNA endonuclease YhcR with UshA esterase domain
MRPKGLIFIANAPESSSFFRMKICWLALALLVFTLNLSADDTKSPALAKIGTGDVTNYFGKEMIVTGKVAQVSIRPNIVFLNMDKPYPDSPFTLVIHPAATNQFGNLKALRGASVEATGVITSYHDRPEIVLEKADQLKVTSPAPTKAPSVSE